jgi:filamentous hemagglutinin family protein
MNAMISSKQLTSRTARHARDLHVSRQLRYKHLAFGVGLALGSLLVCGTASAAGAVAADQSPTGGKVVGGTGSISQSGANTVINQQSKLLALDWQTFNVGKDASVLFNQPGASAIALNRILDQNPSQIFGKVTSNGQIFLINTHGIIFGASAQLNVGGLVASTLDLTPQDFLKEHFSLDAHGANAGIVNHGTIAAASGGSVSLVGGQVQNDGLIVADYGHINLDGADKAVLDFDGNGLISVEITGALQKRLNTDQAAVTNSGTLKATSGTVVLQASAAKGLFTDMVNNAGVIKAAGISTAGGVVRLVGSGGNTVNSGSIDVSGTQGGSVQVLSDQNVDVSGSIHADATQNGDGGNILVKGDDSAGISGTLTARGGVQGGNGGFIETSGTHVHIADGTRVNTQAVSGLTGTWLIDPEDFVIGSTVNSDISGATLSANLGNSGSNVTILSSDGTLNPGGNGDIIVLDPVSWSANHTLTLKAARNIEIDNSVAASGAASLTLEAASSGTADPQNPAGTILIDSGGSLSMKGSGTFSLSNVITNNGALIFGLGSNFSYGGVISGGGTLQQSGSKTLKLTGANTYTGATTIDSGATLQLTGTGSIADSSGVDAEGTFDISSTTSGATIKSLSGANTGKVVLGSQTLTLDNALAAIGATNTFAGVISGNGYVALTGGMQAFTGTNTYKGGTSISGGTLQVSSDAGLGDTTTNAAVTINSGGTLQAGGDFTSARTINIANVANVDTNGHAVTLSGDITSGDPTQGSLNKEGAGTLTLTGTGSEYKFTNVNAGTLALKDAGVLGGQFFSVASGAIFDISQLSGAGVTVDSLDGAGTVDLGGKTLTIGSGNTPWTFSGVLADGGIGGGTGGSLVMDDPNVTGILSGTNTYTGNTTIKNGTLSVSADANLGNGGGVILDGGTLENTASFTLNHALSTGTNGGTLQNDTGTGLTVANAITGTGDLTQNGTGTLTVNGNVTTTGANQTYNGTLALGNAVTLTGTTVNLGTVTGNGHDLTVAGNAVLNGVATVPNLNVTGSGNELNFGTGGSVSGNVDAAKLDYDNYGSAVAVNLSGTGTTGVGGNVSGVSSITSLHNLAVTGVSAGALDLATTGAGATTTLGGLTVNGNLGVDSAGAVLQGVAGPLTVTGTTGINAHANAITLDDAGNSLAGVVTLSNSGANAVTVNNGTQALQLGDVHVGTGSLSLTATGITQATGTTITQAAGAGAASFNAGAGVLTLANAGNDLTGMLGLANTGAFDVTFDNGSNALTLGNVNVGTGTLDISATGITQVPGTGIVQAPGAGAASFDANAGALNLNSTLNDLTGIVNLANSGNFAVYLDNGSHALTLGTLNVGSGPLTITDYGVGALLLTQDITTNGGAVDFGGAVTIDGSPTITVDTTGGGAAGANISFGGDVNAAAPNADSLTLTAGNGAVSFGGAVGNTAALNDLTTASKTFTAASTLGIEGDLAITTTGGPISQGGAWTVLGTSDFDAGGNAITLTNASNSFGGLITATGGAVELAGTGTLDMGAVTASSLKLDGASLLHEDITTTGTQNYNGAVTLDGSGNGVALHGNGVAFASTIDNLSSASLQDLSVDSGTGAAQFNGAVGSLNGPLGALVVSGTGQAQFLGNVAAASLTATAPVLLGANITTSGNQTYNGAVALGTNVVATSANGDVSFGSTLDNAAGTPEALTVTAANGATTFGNAVGTLNGPLGNLTSSSGTFSATAALNIGGDLSVSTTAGAIGQSAAWVVAGNSVFNAGNNAVTLTNPNNDFTGTVTVTGAGVSVRDANDLTIGGLTDNNDGDVSLVAGGQLFGVGPINAGTGSITLTAAGAVLTTAALTGGDIALTGGNGISIGDNVNAGGTLTLTANAGSISEGSTAVITAGTLTGSSSGSTHLDGNNQISNIGNFTANGGFSLTNAQSLTVGTGIAIDGGAGGTALKTTSGDLTVNGTVGNAAGATSLTSAGNINEGAGGVVIGTQLTGASIGDTTLTGANKLASVGQFNAVNFTLVNNAALSVVGPLLTSGDISLTTTGGPANVLNVGQALTGGSVTLDSAGDLSITQMVQGSAVDLTANGNLSIDAAVNSGAGATTLTQNGAGSISEGVGGSITAGTLTGTAQGGATLDGANVIANLGDFTAVGFSLTNAADLTVAAGSTVDGGASTSLTTTGAGSDITIDGNVKGTATSLVSSGAINEGASGVVTADTLTGSAANAVQLTGNNAINKLGNFTAASLTLTNGQSLTILAGNTVDGGSSAALTIDGDLDLDGTLKGTTTTLGATGAINEGAGGAVVAGTLTGNSGGATDLSGNNAVSSLGNFTADGFALTTNQTLTVNAGATVDGGANTTLTTTGSGHDIGIDGTVQGDLITLVSAGAIGEGSGGLVQGGDLTGSSMGDTALANTQIDDLDAFDAANFALTNAGALTVNGPLSTTGNAGDISLTTTGAGNALTVNQAVQGASITLASAGDLTVADAVTGTQVALAANGNLAIDAAVSSGTGTVTLTQTGSGAITGGANGSITAATLTGSATGTTTLGSASQFMANHVDTLGGFSSPTGFSFTNDGTLTLASVGGSAFTVDAGKSAFYLEVHNGDLLQIGSNWLYDGTGSFSAPDGHIGMQTAPIYVTGVSAQSVPAIGLPPAYFYGVDYNGNLLPFTGSNAVNVPQSILSSKSQGTNGHSDQYIDISVVTAVYRPFGIVPTGLLLPPDQSACSPDQPPSEQCPENN